MSRLLLVHTHASATEMVKRHYPFYEKCGADRIVGIVTEDKDCFWPTADTKAIGKDKYIDGPHLPNRLLRTLEFGVNEGADEIVVIEADSIFLNPLPNVLPKGFVLNVSGGPQANYKCSRFFHGPWIMDAETAKEAVRIGDELLAKGEFEHGTPDCFLGLITDLAGISVHENLFTRYSRNGFDVAGHLDEARAAYLAGIDYIHGIKTERELSFITAK